MILEGTTSTGAVVPVQVTTDGKVVAEGMTGPQGPEGPKGDKGDPGSPGNLWSGSDPGPIYYTGGNVGIGTTSPSTLLDVGGAASGASYVTNPKLGIAGDVFFEPGSGNDVQIFNYRTTDMAFGVGGAEKARIDSSGRLLVGTSSNNTVYNSRLQVISDNSVAGGSLIDHYHAGTTGAYLFLRHSRSDTIGTNTILQSGDFIGGVRFFGADGSSDVPAAYIDCVVDGTPGSGDMPGRLVFSTTADGASSATPRMTIFSDGAVAIEEYLVLKSPDGSRWAVEVDNSGNLSTVRVI